MKTEKMQSLQAAAEKAQNTINGKTWEAHKSNAAARLFAIKAAETILSYNPDTDMMESAVSMDYEAAAAYLHGLFIASFNAQVKARATFEASFGAIKAAAVPTLLAAAVGRSGFSFDAAIRHCYQSIRAAERGERAAAFAERTAAAAAKAETKSKNAAKRAARAAERAAALNGTTAENVE